MKFKYETHLHSSPVSRCAKANIEESLKYYKKLGYDGVFLTNHFIGGNFRDDSLNTDVEKVDFYLSDYFTGLKIAREIGIKLFFGVEMSFNHHTDFLVYGLSPEWYWEHLEVINMPFPQRLDYLKMHGAFIVHAHPFRNSFHSDSYPLPISLFPKHVDAVEVRNACNSKELDDIALYYAKHYKLPFFAGSDNHSGEKQKKLCGIITREPICEISDFLKILKEKRYKIF